MSARIRSQESMKHASIPRTGGQRIPVRATPGPSCDLTHDVWARRAAYSPTSPAYSPAADAPTPPAPPPGAGSGGGASAAAEAYSPVRDGGGGGDTAMG